MITTNTVGHKTDTILKFFKVEINSRVKAGFISILLYKSILKFLNLLLKSVILAWLLLYITISVVATNTY
ncbi:hypothetical protein ACFFU9_07500 [Mariniflexile ostreae]|uniref:Uncharacterized protein n=1 Tax=Mariniflexile ostreae TaxID=1520892 RepID=A0ABV5FAV9_9FLAO